MAFSTKRGRPAKPKQQIDKGTKELQIKRLKDSTMEAIDICLKKNLISDAEHSAGIRLRYLYTLRFGATGIRAYHPENGGRSVFRQDNETWLAQRRIEYENTIKILTKEGCKRMVLNICVFNQKPAFLLPYKTTINPNTAHLRNQQFTQFISGMKLLSEALGKQSKNIAKCKEI